MTNQPSENLRILNSDKVNGYGNTPIPSPIDQDVRALVSYLLLLDEDRRDVQLAQMTEKHGFALLAFAERMSSLAVRERHPQQVLDGLYATALAAKLVYVKEALPIVSLLFRSAEKFNIEPHGLSTVIPPSGSQDFDEFVRHFPSRSGADREIDAMGYVEDEDLDGFIYRRTW